MATLQAASEPLAAFTAVMLLRAAPLLQEKRPRKALPTAPWPDGAASHIFTELQVGLRRHFPRLALLFDEVRRVEASSWWTQQRAVPVEELPVGFPGMRRIDEATRLIDPHICGKRLYEVCTFHGRNGADRLLCSVALLTTAKGDPYVTMHSRRGVAAPLYSSTRTLVRQLLWPMNPLILQKPRRARRRRWALCGGRVSEDAAASVAPLPSMMLRDPVAKKDVASVCHLPYRRSGTLRPAPHLVVDAADMGRFYVHMEEPFPIWWFFHWRDPPAAGRSERLSDSVTFL